MALSTMFVAVQNLNHHQDAMSEHEDNTDHTSEPAADSAAPATAPTSSGESSDNARPRELGGRKGPEPTRYGDWEKKGRCIDF
jgi:hypothetical protein